MQHIINKPAKINMEGENIIPFTNEITKEYYKKEDIYNKDVLTPCSSGDHLFDAMLLKAKTVDCFDISESTEHYMQLKTAGIKCLEYDEFFDFFLLKIFENNNKMLFDKKTYLKLRDALSHKHQSAWDSVFEDENYRKKLLDSNFFLNCFCCSKKAKNHSLYTEEENFYSLKKVIDNYNPKFYHTNLIHLPKILQVENNKTYDTIYLSNIVNYWIDALGKDDLHSYREFIENELSHHLNDKGKIFIAYIHNYLVYDHFYGKYKDIQQHSKRKEVFNNPNYTVQTFPGYPISCCNEHFEATPTNAVLIYQKKSS